MTPTRQFDDDDNVQIVFSCCCHFQKKKIDLYLSIWKEITTTLKIIQPQKNIYGEKIGNKFFFGEVSVFFFISVISTRPSHIKYTFTFWNKVFQWQCCGCQNVKTFRQKMHSVKSMSVLDFLLIKNKKTTRLSENRHTHWWHEMFSMAIKDIHARMIKTNKTR